MRRRCRVDDSSAEVEAETEAKWYKSLFHPFLYILYTHPTSSNPTENTIKYRRFRPEYQPLTRQQAHDKSRQKRGHRRGVAVTCNGHGGRTSCSTEMSEIEEGDGRGDFGASAPPFIAERQDSAQIFYLLWNIFHAQ